MKKYAKFIRISPNENKVSFLDDKGNVLDEFVFGYCKDLNLIRGMFEKFNNNIKEYNKDEYESKLWA